MATRITTQYVLRSGNTALYTDIVMIAIYECYVLNIVACGCWYDQRTSKIVTDNVIEAVGKVVNSLFRIVVVVV